MKFKDSRLWMTAFWKLPVLLMAMLASAPGPADPLTAVPFDWPRADAESVGLEAGMLETLEQRTQRGEYGQVRSLMVVRHGKVAYEGYFRGYGPDDLLPLYSVTKSWASALIGIATARGDIAGTDQPLDVIFRQYQDVFQANPGKSALRVRDLLTMRHGLAWDEWSTFFTDSANPVNQMTRVPDWWRFVLERPLTAGVDSVFRYSTGVSNLLGGIIWTATGQSAIDYSAEHLFDALSIDEHYIEVGLSDAPRGTGITDFQAGLTPTGHGLWLKTRDLAKLGQLYLDRGVFDLQRVLPASWIDESWQVYSDESTDPQVFSQGVSYGYQWWGFNVQHQGRSVRVHLADGWADQFLMVVPELDLVVASNAGNGRYHGPDIVDALRDLIVPAVEDGFDPVNDSGLTGSWFSPGLPLQGFMLEIVPTTGQVVIYWMTFEPGSGKQQWMIAVGLLSGRRAVLEFLRPVNGAFVGDSDAQLRHWGEATLEFQDCTNATLAFASADGANRGEIALRRLTPNTVCRDDQPHD